ncbi:hypothetical protein AB6B32_18420 [Acinetobacter baumannii]
MSEFKEFNHEFNKHHAYHAAYSEDYKRGARWGFQHQQAKVEEMQKQKSLQELEVNQIAQANQVWQSRCQKLQKRVDAAIKCADLNFWNANTVEAMVKALKGEGQ